MIVGVACGCASTAVRDGAHASSAQQGAATTSGRTFENPEAAWQAFIAAVRAGSTDEILAILGDDARPFISSADGLNDARARRALLDRADQRTVLGRAEGGVVMAYLGNVGWPFPIPLARAGRGWRFDTAVGRDALVQRRVQYNELRAAAICRTYVWAQSQYASLQLRTSPRKEYARRLISTPGTRDGLYWPAESSADESPMAPLVAAALAEGYQPGRPGEPVPYYGYVYRVLSAQGPHAPGGAHSYLEGERLVRGFALVARPAQYGVTGVKTMMVNQDGTVYQRDLGSRTEAIVAAMTAYDPDASWSVAP